MVVLAVSLISKSGKPLVSRQFVEMTRSRIEGVLSAFTKLVETEKQHTYVETDSIRYVYHPIEDLYLILVTNKQSNILEDIETLRLLSKIVPEYSSLDEESICKAAFELVFAFDEVISLGNREILTVVQVKQYCEMESHEERLHKVVLQSKISDTKDVMKRKASEIDKIKHTVNSKGDKGGGFMGISSRIQSSFSDIGIYKSSNGSGSDSGFGSSDIGSGFNPEIESFSSKSKDRCLTSATAPSKGLGMKLCKSKGANQFLASLKAEGEVILEEDTDQLQPTSTNKSSQQTRASITSSDPLTLIIEEKLIAMIERDGGSSNVDVQGTLSLQVLNQEDGLIQIEVESRETPGLSFRTHPNINRELFNGKRIIGLKDPSRPFPSGQNDVSLVKWRIQGMDETSLPLTVSCWPSVSGSETYVNIEYEASDMFDLQNVVISIPLPAIRESPSVRQIDGEWKYDSRNSTLEWSILLIDSSNLSGSMEFVVPTADDTSVYFPITVTFTSPTTFSGVKVNKILPLKDDGVPPKFSQTSQLVTDTYQVV